MWRLRMQMRMQKMVARQAKRFAGRHAPARWAALLGVVLLASALAACGAQAQGQQRQVTPTASPTLAPSSTPTPTQTPTPLPTATPTPPPSLPAPILDVRPSSMSLVGHLDCAKASAYTCQAEVVSGTGNQQALHWFTSTSVPGHVMFSPASGVLQPGQRTLINITVPLGDCTQGLFFFHGPANTHTISWAC